MIVGWLTESDLLRCDLICYDGVPVTGAQVLLVNTAGKAHVRDAYVQPDVRIDYGFVTMIELEEQ